MLVFPRALLLSEHWCNFLIRLLRCVISLCQVLIIYFCNVSMPPRTIFSCWFWILFRFYVFFFLFNKCLKMNLLALNLNSQNMPLFSFINQYERLWIHTHDETHYRIFNVSGVPLTLNYIVLKKLQLQKLAKLWWEKKLLKIEKKICNENEENRGRKIRDFCAAEKQTKLISVFIRRWKQSSSKGQSLFISLIIRAFHRSVNR